MRVTNNTSAFWIKVNKVMKGDYTVALGDFVLNTRNHKKHGFDLLTASVEDYIAAAIVYKAHKIPLYIIFENKKQLVGLFSVN